ncbi:hypothetical protein [Sandarakinorhabdus sp.]|uniref:hypothetical protein n=1 Tax=Sandarakinorhabdus sp. TaxID=1916663 RepID=UPI003F6F7793
MMTGFAPVGQAGTRLARRDRRQNGHAWKRIGGCGDDDPAKKTFKRAVLPGGYAPCFRPFAPERGDPESGRSNQSKLATLA